MTDKNMQNLVNRFEANGIHLWTENGKIKYKAMNTSDFGNNEYEFTSATNRISLQIRM